MKKLRKHIGRLAIILVALQILNFGFFIQDFQQLTCSASSISDHNIINSLVEYVSEVVLDRVDSVPENNSKANSDMQSQKHIVIKLVEFKQQKVTVRPIEDNTSFKSYSGQIYFYGFFAEINPPPPKA